MKEKSVGLQILWFCEVIISARVLLFTIPVLLNKVVNKSMNFQRADDSFILVVTITAVFYLTLGVSSLIGHKMWKLLHLVSLGFVVLLIIGLYQFVQKANLAMHMLYYSPVIFSILFTAAALFIKSEVEKHA